MTPSKLISVALATVAGFFAVVLLGMTLLVPTELSVAPADNVVELPSVEMLAEPPVMPDDGAFAEFSRRPLFAMDRRPWQPPDIDDEDVALVDEAAEEAPLEELNVRVLGVVISPRVRLATLWNGDTQTVTTVREGDPLDGALSEWTVSSIEPRNVRFNARGDSTSVAEMEIYGGDLGRTAGRSPSRQPTRVDESAVDELEPEAQEEAELRRQAAERREEIRRRIAEARARRQQAQQESEN